MISEKQLRLNLLKNKAHLQLCLEIVNNINRNIFTQNKKPKQKDNTAVILEDKNNILSFGIGLSYG